ncbi:MAG: hypothetical protein K9J81_00085 [Desulfohalobiaceae bacterium]|nr:hypothetical protein [Desulfohalobiaceae bacterium]
MLNEPPEIARVLVDDREGDNAVVEALRAYGACLTTQRLRLGDYRLDEALLIERKTLADLAVSIIDGRLFKQASRLVDSKYSTCLILEGSAREASELSVSKEAIQGALVTVSLILGLPVLRTTTARETAWLMLTAARQLRACDKGAMKRAGYKPKGREKRKLYLLQGLPNIGREKAELLLDAFGGVQAVMDASYEELIQVQGIGRITARNIRNILREPLAEYGQTSIAPEPSDHIIQTEQTE